MLLWFMSVMQFSPVTQFEPSPSHYPTFVLTSCLYSFSKFQTKDLSEQFGRDCAIFFMDLLPRGRQACNFAVPLGIYASNMVGKNMCVIVFIIHS